MGCGDRPDFDFDTGAFTGDSHEAGAMRWTTGQGVKFVFGRGTGAAYESGVSDRELLVEGQSLHVGAADGDGDALLRRTERAGGTGRGEGAGRGGAAWRARRPPMAP